MLQAPRLWDVVEEHLDDAAFLWELWERALVSPVQRPTEIAAHLETRLRANLDGLRLACPDANERLLLPALHSGEPGRIAAAALVLAEQPGGLDHCLRAIRHSARGADGPVARALGLARGTDLNAGLLSALAQRDPRLAATVLDALAQRKVDPGPPLLEWLKSNDPLPRGAAFRAARHTAQPVRDAVEIACASPRAAVRDAALGTALAMGLRSAYASCERLLAAEAPDPGPLYEVLAMSGDPAALPRIVAGLERPAASAGALVALGRAGWPGALDRILDCAEEPALARLAGEAFAAITGVEIEGSLVRAEDPDPEPPAFEDEDLDVSLAAGPERELPLPEPGALRAWWDTQSSRFDPATRHLGGASWTPQRLYQAFVEGAMRRRRVLGLELEVRTQGRWRVDVRAWATDQLAAERTAPPFSTESKLSFSRLLRA